MLWYMFLQITHLLRIYPLRYLLFKSQSAFHITLIKSSNSNIVFLSSLSILSQVVLPISIYSITSNCGYRLTFIEKILYTDRHTACMDLLTLRIPHRLSV